MALLACGAAVVSGDASESFWERHALRAGLAANVIVVMLTVAVAGKVLDRRSRHSCWSANRDRLHWQYRLIPTRQE
ncbi:MAG TPA: hypothetical protein VK802_06235, partial [Streptosporangiaceae bacterium]|nr:hypothetical protein [Streptosporangiaceae bacterium]